jgi:hypothetical protein
MTDEDERDPLQWHEACGWTHNVDEPCHPALMSPADEAAALAVLEAVPRPLWVAAWRAGPDDMATTSGIRFAGDIVVVWHGWRIVIFNDCASWDYIDHLIAPDGRRWEYNCGDLLEPGVGVMTGRVANWHDGNASGIPD